VYSYSLGIRGTGTGGDFFDPAEDSTYATGARYSGRMSANWVLSFPVAFTVDEQRHTVDAEGQGGAGALGQGTILSYPQSSWSNDDWDEFSVTRTPPSGSQSTPESCVLPKTPFPPFSLSGELIDQWASGDLDGGPSSAVFQSGTMQFNFQWGNGALLNSAYKCQGGSVNGSPIAFNDWTVPGFLGDGEGTGPGCSLGQAGLAKAQHPAIQVPVEDLGGAFVHLRFEEAFTCVPTMLGAAYTAHVKYLVVLFLRNINGTTPEQFRAAYLKDLLAAGVHLDDALKMLRGERHIEVGTEEEIRSDLHDALKELLFDDKLAALLPPGAVRDIYLALGWIHDALDSPTLPAVESSTKQADKEVRATEQVM
jgi:hypothetical protein